MLSIHRSSRKQFLFATLALFVAPLLSAQIPAGYYDGVDSASSAGLRQTLHEAIDDHQRFPYTSSSGTDTWDILNLADEDPNNSANIVDIYKNASYQKIAGGVGAYNREHSWPKSYGFPNDGSTNYPYTDTHHLFAADSSYNSSRSNKPFRDCHAGCLEKTTDFNDGRGGGSGVYPGNSSWTEGQFAQGTWQTWYGRKGDVARAMFYMAIRYEGGVHSITGVTEPDLILTDNELLIESYQTGSNEAVAYMGMLSVLLQWHLDDPVDSRELYRNEVVYSFQGNRNPFIDHPEWVACVFEANCAFDTTAPAAPTGLFATAGSGLVDLSWNANGEADLAGYDVWRSTLPSSGYALVNSQLVTTVSFTDTMASNSTTYYYLVTAVDSSGNQSTDSNIVSATPQFVPDTTPPSPPTALSATAGDGSVSLDWADNGEPDLDGYFVYRATAIGGPYGQLGTFTSTSNATDLSVAGGTTYYYLVTAVDTSNNESGDSNVASATPAAGGGTGQLLLSEVFYDPSGTDDGLEWVELFNAGATTIDLSLYSLGNGGTSYTYSTVQLSGLLPAGAIFVVGGATSSSTNGFPTFDQVFNFSPDFQNSGSTADAIALFDVPAAQIDGSTVPIDAVIYGGANNNGLIDETGTANAPEVGDVSSGFSIERIDLAGNWQAQGNPNPNSSSLAAEDTAPTVAITSPAHFSTFLAGDSINFTGTADDVEDGSLSASLSWSSSLDGSLGGGASLFSSTLSVGTHVITASVTDSGGLSASDSITISVNANTAPVVNITAPATGSTVLQGSAVTFSGSASDTEDGDLGGSLSWSSSLDGAIGSGASFASSTLSIGSHTITASATDSGGLSSIDIVTLTIEAPPAGQAQLILSEVFYDPTSTDTGLEWVEIYNAGDGVADLSGYSLGNGGTDYTYSKLQLSGLLGAGQIFVVGGPTSSAANGSPSFDLAIDFNPDFQNSGTTADGVALFDVTAAQVNASTVPIDAVIYGGANNNGLIDETGGVNAPEVGDAPSSSSIERTDLAGSWRVQADPNPNQTLLDGSNSAPTAAITAPATGSTSTEGDAVLFTGSADDLEDGDLASSLSWSSDLDGALGSGASLSISTLSIGTHSITASVTDSGGLSGSDTITLTIEAGVITPTEVTFTSIGAEDGWIRESSENSNVGGSKSSNSGTTTALRAGDERKDRQYKAIVSFDTSSLPAGATILSARLRVKRGKLSGSDPFSTHGSCRIDVSSGGFGGNPSLASSDFEATATAASSATLSRPASNGQWAEATLDSAGLLAIDNNGRTQLRLAFDLDDNDDKGNDYVGFYSGDNGTAANHPQLVVVYQ